MQELDTTKNETLMMYFDHFGFKAIIQTDTETITEGVMSIKCDPDLTRKNNKGLKTLYDQVKKVIIATNKKLDKNPMLMNMNNKIYQDFCNDLWESGFYCG